MFPFTRRGLKLLGYLVKKKNVKEKIERHLTTFVVYVDVITGGSIHLGHSRISKHSEFSFLKFTQAFYFQQYNEAEIILKLRNIMQCK
jgi:hypothetical protein